MQAVLVSPCLRLALLLSILILPPASAQPQIDGDAPGDQPGQTPLLYKTSPITLRVADFGPNITSASITDVAVADFNGDGRKDLAVAWYATDPDDPSACLRAISIFGNTATGFDLVATINLYLPDPDGYDPLSIFRNGTAAIAVGDFDGDGDPDLAATAFFGDELWFIENRGDWQFTPYLKFPYGFNSDGNFITPPRALAADFNGDGRDELVYLVDPVQRFGGRFLHFWKTSTGSIADMQRVDWSNQVQDGDLATYWLWGLTVADFDRDGKPDLCFTGCTDPGGKFGPMLVFWYGLNLDTKKFQVKQVPASMMMSDVAWVAPNPSCAPNLLVTDRDGLTVQYWTHDCSGSMNTWTPTLTVTGYAGLSWNRGMAAGVADVNGDGQIDLVTKQKLGEADDAGQIEITLSSSQGAHWTRVSGSGIDTAGFQDDPFNEILRPRNLIVADLLGNTLPEIVGGFGSIAGEPHHLDVGIWQNSCLGDVNRDGITDGWDYVLMRQGLGRHPGQPGFIPDADLDRNGTIDQADILLLQSDMGCRCRGPCVPQRLGDSNCDGKMNGLDMDAFVTAVCEGRTAWEQEYGHLGCDFLCVNDINMDGVVNIVDSDPFVKMLTGQ